MPTSSRGSVFAGLRPLNWVVLFEQLEASDGPVYYYRRVNLHLEGESTNAAAVTVKIQDSNDGVTWVDRYAHPQALQPGGEIQFSYFHVRPHVRCILYSTGGGRVDGSWLKPEAQTLPHLVPDEHITMSCSTFCEQDCETGTETAG